MKIQPFIPFIAKQERKKNQKLFKETRGVPIESSDLVCRLHHFPKYFIFFGGELGGWWLDNIVLERPAIKMSAQCPLSERRHTLWAAEEYEEEE